MKHRLLLTTTTVVLADFRRAFATDRRRVLLVVRIRGHSLQVAQVEVLRIPGETFDEGGANAAPFKLIRQLFVITSSMPCMGSSSSIRDGTAGNASNSCITIKMIQ